MELQYQYEKETIENNINIPLNMFIHLITVEESIDLITMY